LFLHPQQHGLELLFSDAVMVISLDATEPAVVQVKTKSSNMVPVIEVVLGEGVAEPRDIAR